MVAIRHNPHVDERETTRAPSSSDDIGASTEQLLDSAPDGMVITDQNGLIRLVNRQAELIFGYDRSELVGQPVEILVPERVREAHSHHRWGFCASPTTRPMGAELELSARRKDGAEFPVDVSLSSLETPNGALVSAAVRDITERKRMEEDRFDLQDRLQRAQRDEERAHLQAQHHQAQRLESVGQLAGGVAHDFNNLLAGIMNYCALVADGLREQIALRALDGDEAFLTLAQDVQEITNVAQRGAALTRQLLIFSRREVIKPEVLDLNSVVAEMDKLLRRTIGEDIDLQTSAAPGLPHTKVDRGQMGQILMNLAVNARDAMPNGGRLEITTAAFEVDESYGRARAIDPGPYVRLTVADTGAGMSPDALSRAFEPFFTTKPRGAGSGLGLATVHGIAAQAGGDVVIYSEPGLGCTVRLILPVTSDDPTLVRVAEEETPIASKGETILLVEDEEIVRDPARRILVRHGYVVMTAADAEAALAVALEHTGPIDLLLTDVVMPGRSGKELAADITATHPTTRVLFMSGYSHDVIVHQGVLDDGVNLIEKPFPAKSLLRMVRDVLDAES